MRDILQDDGLHSEDVGKLHLRDVQRTHNVGPAWWRDWQWINGTIRFPMNEVENCCFYSISGKAVVPLCRAFAVQLGRKQQGGEMDRRWRFYLRCLSSWGLHLCGDTAHTSGAGEERVERVVSVAFGWNWWCRNGYSWWCSNDIHTHHARRPLLWLTLPTEPRTGGHLDNAIACWRTHTENRLFDTWTSAILQHIHDYKIYIYIYICR